MVETPQTASAGTPQTQLWIDAWQKLGTAMQHMAGKPLLLPAKQMYDQAEVVEALTSVAKGWAAQPEKLLEVQWQAWQDVTKLWTSAWLPAGSADPVVKPARGDRRFGHEGWDSNPLFNQFKQNYLIASQAIRAMINASAEPDSSKRAMTAFLVEQFLNATAPSNFALGNPEVVAKTVETGGANLVAGFANFIEDLSEGRGIVRRRAPATFTLGENLAATPGGVIYQNDLIQLIQYTPTTKTVSARPMLYVAPLVNKYYMIDLQPKSSLIRWLVEQGHTVFVVSWVDPDESHRHCALEDYVGRGVIQAMDVVRDITGEPDVDLFGFCMGGTLITMAQAVLTARGEGERAGSTTLIGSLVDFRDMRDWAGFVNEAHVDMLDSHVDERGFIDKAELQQLFSMMRSNDLIWSSVVGHYLLDKEAPSSDLLFWFEDGSHIPQAFLKSYNSTLLVNNHLTDPGKVELLGERLDLGQIITPMFIIGLKDDHVSAWDAVYHGTHYFGGPVQFVLGGSGHNAGVINPPTVTKHGFWTNPELAADADDWLAAAERHEGSWWPYWSAWLNDMRGDRQVAARAVGCDKYPVIESAPGSFVTAGKQPAESGSQP